MTKFPRMFYPRSTQRSPRCQRPLFKSSVYPPTVKGCHGRISKPHSPPGFGLWTAVHHTVPLSEAAVNRLIQLPHLRILRIAGPPPRYSTASLPLVFPPLVELTLGEDTARGWLSLFKRLEHEGSATRDVTPSSTVGQSLKSLVIVNTPGPTIDDTTTTSVQIFRNLVDLRLEDHCHDEDDEGQCAFKLSDDDVAKLSMDLPHLESLLLGHACHENTCATTVACLLPLSFHCLKLQQLEVHFNTLNIINDLKNVSEDPRFQELR